ncbi:putative leucine-rich repeat receptor-like serine/threonine-protein kinase [Iris pallida]|uniref:Leucine-rich repeat receptor-like serine/threonine-protein kinase n=1 Tax=Iris pallida TaxID=29817 RepID=A0AAX6FG07_IRIPA|nr:putative leucine-rich repeat receptor-like serine/threonine-protein kinase [Iris pallida]
MRAFLAMKTDGVMDDMIESDLREIGIAATKLADHLGFGFGTSFLAFLACAAAIYLLILDRTNWKTNMLTSLLIPYIFLSLPTILFSFFRGEVGLWIAFVAVVLRLFFPRRFPDWLELPGALILLLVVAPGFFTDRVRGNVVGVFICLVIGCYLLQEHIRASGGFRKSFTQSKGVSNSIGIILIMVYPVWWLVLYLM